MPALKISLDYFEAPPNETPVLTSCKVNQLELVGPTSPTVTLIAFATALLFAKLGKPKIGIVQGTFSGQLDEVIRKKDSKRARVDWFKQLREADLFDRIMTRGDETKGLKTKLLIVNVPEKSIRVALNGMEIKDLGGIRELLQRLKALDVRGKDIKHLCETAEILDRNKETQAAVDLLNVVRRWNLSPELAADVAGSLGKFLIHLGRIAEAIDVLVSALKKSGIAEPYPDQPRGVWRLDRAELKADQLSLHAISILRCMLQLSIAYRVSGTLQLAKRQLEAIRDYEEVLKRTRSDLLLSTIHQQHRVYVSSLLHRNGAETLLQLVRRNYRASDEDRMQLKLLEKLAEGYEKKTPRDPQRLGFEYRGLGEWSYFLRKAPLAKRYLSMARDMFDEAADKRNHDATGDIMDDMGFEPDDDSEDDAELHPDGNPEDE